MREEMRHHHHHRHHHALSRARSLALLLSLSLLSLTHAQSAADSPPTPAQRVEKERCLRNSYAPAAVAALQKKKLNYREATTLTKISEIVQVMAQVFYSNDYGHNVEIYVGMANGDVFSVKNCWVYEQINDRYCIAAGARQRYITEIRSQAVFGDDKLHAYKLDDLYRITGAKMGISTLSYDPRTRPWYALSSGWTEPYTFFASGQQGETYVLPLLSDGVTSRPANSEEPLLGVIGADRTGNEDCNPSCTTNSYAEFAVKNVHDADIYAFHGIGQSSGFQAVVDVLRSAMRTTERGFNNFLYFGTTRGDFYGLKNCYTKAAVSDRFCNLAGPLTQYVFWARNSVVFGDSQRHCFKVSFSGLLQDEVGATGEDYDSRTQSWFKVPHSLPSLWSQPFEIVPGLNASTFSMGSQGVAVIAADRTNDEPCYNACEVNSYAAPACHNAASDTELLDLVRSPKPTFEQIGQIMDRLIRSWRKDDRGFGLFVFFGTIFGDFYGVKNCWIPEHSEDPFCIKAGPGVELVAWIKNEGIFNDTYRHTYIITPDFRLGKSLGVQSINYQTTQRPWYQIGLDWTADYSFPDGTLGNTYAVTARRLDGSMAGVVGADHTYSEPCYNPCDLNSYSKGAALIVAATPGVHVPVTDMAALATAIGSVLEAMKKADRGFSIMLFYGLENGDMYGVTNCFAPENAADKECIKGGTQYKASIRNEAIFGNKFRHYYRITIGGVMDTENGYLGRSPTEYPTTQRSWYILQSGFTANYLFFSGVVGKTYAYPIRVGTKLMGVAAADKSFSEPCYDTCKRNSYARPATQLLAASPIVEFENIENFANVSALVPYMLTAYRRYNFGYTQSLLFGTASGDFYGLYNCWVKEKQNNKFCHMAGTEYEVMLYIRNPKLFGTQRRNVYALTPTGNLGPYIGEEDNDFDSRAQHWYTLRHSWSHLYAFPGGQGAQAHGVAIPRTYFPEPVDGVPPLPKIVGVVAAERTEREPCQDSCNTNSHAVPMCQALLNSNVTAYGHTSDTDIMAAVITKVVRAYEAHDHGYNLLVWLGVESGDWYAVYNCWALEQERHPFCVKAGPSMRLMASIRNFDIFGDKRRHFYTLLEDATLGEYLGKTDVDYPTTERPWYTMAKNVGPGFTDPYLFADGSVGLSFARPVYSVDATLVGVVGADKSEREPCYDACKANSYAYEAAHAISPAIRDLIRGQTLDTVDKMRPIISALYLVSLQYDYGFNVFLFAGMANGDFWGIKNCYSLENVNSPECLDAGSNTQLLAFVRSVSIYGDTRRRVYKINQVGQMTDLVTMSAPYPTTERSWYILGAGWTAPYMFSSGSRGLTYAARGDIEGMVVGVDKTSVEQCRNPCLANTYAIPSTHAIATTAEPYAIANTSAIMNSAMYQVFRAFWDYNYGVNVELGFSTGDNHYYAIKNCWSYELTNEEMCRLSGAENRLVGVIVSFTAFNNYNPHYFMINIGANGAHNVLSDFFSVGATPFYATKEEWYTRGTLWGLPFDFSLYTGAFGRTHATQGRDPTLRAYAIKSTREPCFNSCERYSYAPLVARAIATSDVFSSYQAIARIDKLASVARSLLEVYERYNYGANVMVYIAFNNSDFYGIRNCYSEEFRNSEKFCQQSETALTFWVRNDKIFGTKKRRVYPVENGKLGEMMGITEDNYETTQRPWYTPRYDPQWAFEWTNKYKFSNGGLGRTFSHRLPYNGGVAAVDRTDRETCNDKCLEFSYARPAVHKLSSLSPPFRSTVYYKTAAETVFKVFVAYDNGKNVFLFLGTPRGDFYGIENCRIPASWGSFCKQNGGPDYAAWIRNEEVFGDKRRRVFAMTADGRLGELMGVEGKEYPTTERSWYKLGTGWTLPYLFSDGIVVGVTYALPVRRFLGEDYGVVGADRASDESCKPNSLSGLPVIDDFGEPADCPAAPSVSGPPARSDGTRVRVGLVLALVVVLGLVV